MNSFASPDLWRAVYMVLVWIKSSRRRHLYRSGRESLGRGRRTMDRLLRATGFGEHDAVEVLDLVVSRLNLELGDDTQCSKRACCTMIQFRVLRARSTYNLSISKYNLDAVHDVVENAIDVLELHDDRRNKPIRVDSQDLVATRLPRRLDDSLMIAQCNCIQWLTPKCIFYKEPLHSGAWRLLVTSCGLVRTFLDEPLTSHSDSHQRASGLIEQRRGSRREGLHNRHFNMYIDASGCLEIGAVGIHAILLYGNHFLCEITVHFYMNIVVVPSTWGVYYAVDITFAFLKTPRQSAPGRSAIIACSSPAPYQRTGFGGSSTGTA
ncbi:hypothetical protein KCU93_g263, partial [Aureobasidium melanogenum]